MTPYSSLYVLGTAAAQVRRAATADCTACTLRTMLQLPELPAIRMSSSAGGWESIRLTEASGEHCIVVLLFVLAGLVAC